MARIIDRWDVLIVDMADAILLQAPPRSTLETVVSKEHQKFREAVCDVLESLPGRELRRIAMDLTP